MKTIKYIPLFILLSFFAKAQSTDDVLNTLVQRGILKQEIVDSLRSETAIKEQENPKNQSILIDAEIKPRFEFRNGYGNSFLPSSTSVPASFVNQRTRLNIAHEWKGVLKSYVSIQDVRIWGQHDPRGLNGTFQLFEGYVEPIINENWSLRIGRQRLMLDNQRLFAENDWRVNAGSHDALRIIYQNEKLTGELFGAFNQSTEKFYGTDFDFWDQSTQPNNTTGYNNTWGNQWYKSLIVGHLKYQPNKDWTLTTINTADAFQRNQGKPAATTTPNNDAQDAEHYFWRLTYGGRIEYQKGSWYATFSGYNQSGDNRAGKTIKAFYLQPEIKFTKENAFTIRLGAEILSGDGDSGNTGSVDGNFDALYGVAHRFNGFMDFFTSFGTSINSSGVQTANHLKNQGLINPYLFIIKPLGQKWEIGSYSHLFWTQHNYKTGGKEYDKFLGYEHDLLIKYKPNKITSLETGLSFALPTEDFAALKGNTNSDFHTATWAYVQLTIRPTLLKTKF